MDGRRALDLALAGVALAGFAPAIGVAAILIRIDDGGPILFRQQRLGRDGAPFEILELRTMRGGVVTRVGRWLRATGIDEVPQFWNVVRGEMSVVGPRPLTRDDATRLAIPAARLRVRPGITGLAQLHGGRGARHSRRLDRLQIARSSARLDLELVAASFVVNVLGKARAERVVRAVRRRARRIRRSPIR